MNDNTHLIIRWLAILVLPQKGKKFSGIGVDIAYFIISPVKARIRQRGPVLVGWTWKEGRGLQVRSVVA